MRENIRTGSIKVLPTNPEIPKIILFVHILQHIKPIAPKGNNRQIIIFDFCDFWDFLIFDNIL